MDIRMNEMDWMIFQLEKLQLAHDSESFLQSSQHSVYDSRDDPVINVAYQLYLLLTC